MESLPCSCYMPGSSHFVRLRDKPVPGLIDTLILVPHGPYLPQAPGGQIDRLASHIEKIEAYFAGTRTRGNAIPDPYGSCRLQRPLQRLSVVPVGIAPPVWHTQQARQRLGPLAHQVGSLIESSSLYPKAVRNTYQRYSELGYPATGSKMLHASRSRTMGDSQNGASGSSPEGWASSGRRC